jgi:hypothetical protein
MTRARTLFSRFAAICLAAIATLATATDALADKLHLKDGRVLEGTITSETAEYVYFKIQVGGIEHTDIFPLSDIKQIERDSVTNPVPATGGTGTGAAAKPVRKPGRNDGVHRIAILNFGPPSTWGGVCEDMVGREVSAAAFKRAIEPLQKDGVTDVVIRINSGGGALLEIEKFHNVFEEYKTKFRTVCWVESAISAAAMSPWVIEEFYMMPNGNIGACTGWFGALQAVKGPQLEMVLLQMERASKVANRNPLIMRAMQIQQPLSATIDPVTGNVKWFGDESGEKILNPVGQILTFNAADAVKYKFAKAIAASKEELAEAMLGTGVEYEWAGKEASDIVDNSIRTNDKATKEAIEVVVKYARAIQEAASIQDLEERGAAVGRARRMLAQLESWVKQNPNLEFFLAGYVGAELNREWFTIQRERLKELLR